MLKGVVARRHKAQAVGIDMTDQAQWYAAY